MAPILMLYIRCTLSHKEGLVSWGKKNGSSILQTRKDGYGALICIESVVTYCNLYGTIKWIYIF